MKTIVAISEGSYSDYRVLALFEDEKTAQAWLDAIKADQERTFDEPRLEWFMLVSNETIDLPHKVTTHEYVVELFDNGQMGKPRQSSTTEWAIIAYHGLPPSRPRVRYVRAPLFFNLGGRLEVIGDSAEAVAKVAGEKIAMWKAGAWGVPGHTEIIEGGDTP